MHTFAEFNRVKACRYGQMVFNGNDAYIGRSLELYGEFSEGEVELFRQVVHPGHVVIEVGANIGAHTLFFARQVGERGGVLAFEPQRLAFQALCANMALNHVTNAWCFAHAVGAAPGAITVPTLDPHARNNFAGLALGGHAAGERVPLRTLDQYALPACQLIKIDVEGMEQQVLQGAARLLQQHRPLLYVENDRAEHEAELIRRVDQLGYAMYWHCPPLFNPANFAQNPVNVFGAIVSRNMLCVHRDTPARIAGLPAVDVPRAEEARH